MLAAFIFAPNMTNLEALGAAVNYPVDKIKLQKLLIDNGLIETDEYIYPVTKPFELATAGLYVLLVTSPNISEGGFSLSMAEKTELSKLAAGIYYKYDIQNPLNKTPKIKDRSDRW